MQTFNALNGQELKKAILASIEHEMDASSEFRLNITYPWVKWDANVRVLSYPKQGMNDEPGINLTGSGEKAETKDGISTAPPAEPEVVLDLNLGRVVNTPDAEREKTAQPIPTQAVGPGGQHVDKPVLSPRSTSLLKPAITIDTNGKEIKTKPLNLPIKATNVAESGSPIGIPGIDGSAQ